jgi:hypothetical protein
VSWLPADDIYRTYVVDVAVVEEQHHLTVEIDDLPAHGGGGLRLVPHRHHAPDLLQLPLADDELLLIEEEDVDLLDLGVKRAEEPGLLLRHRRAAAGGGGLDAALELLVAQELILPLWQALLDLPLEPLAKLHLRIK